MKYSYLNLNTKFNTICEYVEDIISLKIHNNLNMKQHI